MRIPLLPTGLWRTGIEDSSPEQGGYDPELQRRQNSGDRTAHPIRPGRVKRSGNGRQFHEFPAGVAAEIVEQFLIRTEFVEQLGMHFGLHFENFIPAPILQQHAEEPEDRGRHGQKHKKCQPIIA